MIYKIKINAYLLIIFSLLTFSCEEIINLDLNQADPQLVIEGTITDQPGPYTVRISQTTDYYNPGGFPMISNARVIISDNLHNTEILTETAPGIYQTDSLRGVPGRTYQLNVEAVGKVLSATSTLPAAVEIDQLSYISHEMSFRGKNQKRYDIICVFQDDPDVDNYCTFRVHRNDTLESRYFLYNDRLSNGNIITYERFRGIEFKQYDMVKVSLLSIDQATYEYYSTLNDVIASDPRGKPSTGAPANPNSNIVGDALGYFGAFSVRAKYVYLSR